MIYAILLLLLLIAGVVCCIAYHCFDDDDPDQFWSDNYGVIKPPAYRAHPEICRHPREYHYIKVLDQIVNCETTVTACALCGKHLTEPETECR